MINQTNQNEKIPEEESIDLTEFTNEDKTTFFAGFFMRIFNDSIQQK